MSTRQFILFPNPFLRRSYSLLVYVGVTIVAWSRVLGDHFHAAAGGGLGLGREHVRNMGLITGRRIKTPHAAEVTNLKTI
jgi:hypothetical protein